MFCGNDKYYGQYKAIVSWSDLVLFCGIDDKHCHVSYGTERNPPSHAPFLCLFHCQMAFPSRRPVDILL